MTTNLDIATQIFELTAEGIKWRTKAEERKLEIERLHKIIIAQTKT